MASTPELIFHALTTEADLSRLIQESREEDLHLEFKQTADRRIPDLGDTDRRGFSKALSGFANAAGGVLVFGVATTKSATGVDCASQLKPITIVDLLQDAGEWELKGASGG